MSEPFYRYFAQAQINQYTNSIVGFELLLKRYQDHRWQTQQDFNAIPFGVVAEQLIQATQALGIKAPVVAVNLDQVQLEDPTIRHALVVAQRQLRPTRLMVELLETSKIIGTDMNRLIPMLDEMRQQGIDFALDDVGSGRNTWPAVKPLLAHVTAIKYALQNRGETLAHTQVQEMVTFWYELAKEHRLTFILEGIETKADDACANKLAIDIRQGYYYARPVLIKVFPDDPQ